MSFDTATPSDVTMMAVSGAGPLVGIDLRPSNNTLIGVTTANEIVTIDPATGAATPLSTMNTPLPMDDAAVIVDFNPMADRMRLMTGTTNHRVNVDTGEVTVDGSLAFETADMHAGEAPAIAAAAYTNAYGKPEATAMYDIDTTIGALIRQTKPNDGTLAAVGKLGIDLGDTTPPSTSRPPPTARTPHGWSRRASSIPSILKPAPRPRPARSKGVDGDLIDIAVMPAT